MAVLGKITQQKIFLLIEKPWFIPVIISLAINGFGIIPSFLLDETILPINLYVSESRQQAILSVMASSLMTLVGLSFSISMLILSTVSTQFGPRLLPNFINSKMTQITFGSFLGTFIFCLFCMSYPADTMVRGLQTIYAILLTLNCLTILVIFINHVMNAIRIDGVLDVVAQKTKKVIAQNYSEGDGVQKIKENEAEYKKPTDYINAKTTGYIQGIDYNKLKSQAVEHGLVLQVHVKPGDFVYLNETLIAIHAKSDNESNAYCESLVDAVHILNSRLFNQDLEYGFEQISEIAVRALSPGINDPYTARECVYLIADLLLFLDKHEDIELNGLTDNNHAVVLFKSMTYAGVIDAGISRLRQAAIKDMAVILAIFDTIIKVTPLMRNITIIQLLFKQAKELSQITEDTKLSNHDRQAIKEREMQLTKLNALLTARS